MVNFSADLEINVKSAPAFANVNAVERPIPEEAPQTIACFPLNESDAKGDFTSIFPHPLIDIVSICFLT